MNKWIWSLCCQKAVEKLKRIGIIHAKNFMNSHRVVQGILSESKILSTCKQKENLPPFLQQNPDLCTSLLEYAREHLHELSIEFLSENIHDTILPVLIMEKHHQHHHHMVLMCYPAHPFLDC